MNKNARKKLNKIRARQQEAQAKNPPPPDLSKIKAMYPAATAEDIALATKPKTIELIDGKKVDRADNKGYRQSAKLGIRPKKIAYKAYPASKISFTFFTNKIHPEGELNGWRIATTKDAPIKDRDLIKLMYEPPDTLHLGHIDYGKKLIIVDLNPLEL